MTNKQENVICPSSLHLCIPFSSEKSALMVSEVINVDQEIPRGSVQRKIYTTGDILMIEFKGDDLKKLRVSLNSILKSILLILKTYELFESN